MRLVAIPAAPHVRRALGAMALALLALATACDDEVTVTPPVEVPLTPGTWYLHSANGTAVPGAEIARRFIGVVDEQTLVDSGRLHVNFDGTFEQRLWMRVLHAGALDRVEVLADSGSWIGEGNVTTFTSAFRARTFEVTSLSEMHANSDEPMVFFANATNVAGVYRTTPPAP